MKYATICLFFVLNVHNLFPSDRNIDKSLQLPTESANTKQPTSEKTNSMSQKLRKSLNTRDFVKIQSETQPTEIPDSEEHEEHIRIALTLDQDIASFQKLIEYLNHAETNDRCRLKGKMLKNVRDYWKEISPYLKEKINDTFTASFIESVGQSLSIRFKDTSKLLVSPKLKLGYKVATNKEPIKINNDTYGFKLTIIRIFNTLVQECNKRTNSNKKPFPMNIFPEGINDYVKIQESPKNTPRATIPYEGAEQSYFPASESFLKSLAAELGTSVSNFYSTPNSKSASPENYDPTPTDQPSCNKPTQTVLNQSMQHSAPVENTLSDSLTFSQKLKQDEQELSQLPNTQSFLGSSLLQSYIDSSDSDSAKNSARGSLANSITTATDSFAFNTPSQSRHAHTNVSRSIFRNKS